MAEVIRGMVRDQDGRPLADARVFLGTGPVPLPDIATITGADGAFALSAPVPGEYSILCSLADGRSDTRNITVSQGSDVEVAFEMTVE